MLTLKRLFLSLLSLLLLLSAAIAQDERITGPTKDSSLVTASVNGERLRFTTPTSVVQLRLEVYNSTGNKIFDNEVRGANILDWRLQDAQAQPLADDAYLCVLTLKSLSGKLSQSFGSVKVEKNSASLQPADRTQVMAQQVMAQQVMAQQAQAILPAEENISLTVLKEDEKQTTNVIAHNGEDGLITRGRGALSFRIGDFFRGKETEQMRLTAEGNLGIGITDPQVRLDVDGLIRASQGIVFPDGSVQFSAARKTFGAASLDPGQSLDRIDQGQEHAGFRTYTGGTGTTGKIAKWLDGPNGILTDSNITELTGNIGIGTVTPGFRLEVVDSSSAGLRVQTNTKGGRVASFGGNGNFEIDSPGNPGGRLKVMENGDIGTGLAIGFAPAFKLHVIDSSNRGLRVQNQTPGGTVASFGINGDFRIDSNAASGGRFTVLENGNVGIGANNPSQRLRISGTGVTRALVNSDSNAGFGLSLNNAQKWSLATTSGEFQIFNDANGQNALFIDALTNNVGIGTTPGGAKLWVNSSSPVGLIVTTGLPHGTVGEFGGLGDFLIDSSASAGGRFAVREDSTVEINNPPPGTATDTALRLVVNGVIKAGFPANGSSNVPLCHDNLQRIVECTSSIRYKENVNNYLPGLNLIGRLRPVSFNWKQDGVPDMGLIAEEVASVEPLLVTHSAKGEIVGVKYDRVAVVLLNAVKEQQAQIKQQSEQIRKQQSQLHNQGQLIKQQQSQLEGLKRLVCKTRRHAARACN